MAKTIVVTCPHCGKKLKTDDRYLGRKGRCPKCQAAIVLSEDPEGAAGGPEPAEIEASSTGDSIKLDLLKFDLLPNGAAVVRFTTSRMLDQSNVTQLGQEFNDLIEKHGLKRMVINFERIHYMSSAVVGKLIALNKRIKTEKGELKLCCIDQSVFEIFKIMRLDKVFKVFDTEDEAKNSLGT